MKCIVAIANRHVIVNQRDMVLSFRLSALLSFFPSIFCFDVSAVRRASARNGAEELVETSACDVSPHPAFTQFHPRVGREMLV